MGLEHVEAGKQVPNDVNVIIEIPSRSDPIKYEVDKKTGCRDGGSLCRDQHALSL